MKSQVTAKQQQRKIHAEMKKHLAFAREKLQESAQSTAMIDATLCFMFLSGYEIGINVCQETDHELQQRE